MNAREVWGRGVRRGFGYEGERGKEEVPVMLLGLKRDLRGDGEGWVEPQEVSFLFLC